MILKKPGEAALTRFFYTFICTKVFSGKNNLHDSIGILTVSDLQIFACLRFSPLIIFPDSDGETGDSFISFLVVLGLGVFTYRRFGVKND